jgi:hypothetical protein
LTTFIKYTREMRQDAAISSIVTSRSPAACGGIATIGAAVSAGLAVAALGRRVAPLGTLDIGPQLGLPPLPSRDVMLYSSLTDRQARGSLRALAVAIRSSAVHPARP